MEKLYMVDLWGTIDGQFGDGGHAQDWHTKNYNEAIERVKPYREKVKVLRGMSVKMASKVKNNTLGLVYIDCDHSYWGVKNDTEAWYPKLVSGGIMAYHDYISTQYQVKEAVEEFTQNLNLIIHQIPENKPEDAGAYFFKP